VRTKALKAGVVGVEGVVVVVYSGGVHWGPFPLGLVPGSCCSCGTSSLFDTRILLYMSTFVYEYARMFP
jgi:hypothetical protein